MCRRDSKKGSIGIAILILILILGGGAYLLRQKSEEGNRQGVENGGSLEQDMGGSQKQNQTNGTGSPPPKDTGSSSKNGSSSGTQPQPQSTLGGLPVFPGALGFGTNTKAGRGGRVIEVMNLNDSGQGSLREALLEKGPRIIVFKVGGVIKLKEALYINDPFVTVAGQTAPGDGITIRDVGLTILTHDVLVQHLRIRPGNEGDVEAKNNDAVGILGGEGDTRGGTYNVVLDHVSLSWAEDETLSSIGGVDNMTISNSIISEALDKSRPNKGGHIGHSAGLLFTDTNNFSAHGNLLAHNGFRNPLIINNYLQKEMLGEFVNNVVYNWGVLATEMANYSSKGPQAMRINIVGNTYRFGPSVDSKWPIMLNFHRDALEEFPQLFVSNNDAADFTSLFTPQDIAEKNISNDEYKIVRQNGGLVDKAVINSTIRAPIFPTPLAGKATSASASYEKALAGAGATKPKRDAIDARIVSDVRNRTGKIIDSPSQVGGFPNLQGGTPYTDSDHDGMSNEWENSHGLNPSDKSDGNKDQDGDGYTNVEEFLHSLM